MPRAASSRARRRGRRTSRRASSPIYGSDYGFATIGAAVSRVAARTAPGVRFRFMLHNTPIVDDAANSLRSVDAMVIPHGYLTDLPYEDLWRDRWVVVADEVQRAGRGRSEHGDPGAVPVGVHVPLALGVHLGRAPAAAAGTRARGRRRRRELPGARTTSSSAPTGSVWFRRRSRRRSAAWAASAFSSRPSMRPPRRTRCGGIPSTTAIPSTRGCAPSSSRRPARCSRPSPRVTATSSRSSSRTAPISL